MKPQAFLCLLGLLLFAPPELRAASCNATATSISFGDYDVFSNTPLISTGLVTVDCKNPEQHPLAVTVAITSGNSGSYCPRRMARTAGGADRLEYNIFTDAGWTDVWGDGTACSSTVTRMVTKDSTWQTVLYGKVPGGQDIAAGAYSDTVVVSVTW